MSVGLAVLAVSEQEVAEKIKGAFSKSLSVFLNCRAIKKFLSGEVSKTEYSSLLEEIHHYTKHNPQIQAHATVFFRGKDRELVKTFLQHATSEVGHDLLALRDIDALGFSSSEVEARNPLPATMALTSFVFYQIAHRRAVGYLGYLYFLEHLSTGIGGHFSQLLDAMGVPKSAQSFVGEHMSVDVAHNRLMETYLKQLVRTREDLSEVCYAMQVSGHLYAQMFDQAMDRANDPSGLDMGLNLSEVV
jgi:pyrroloquinoline quinone (PQQ) biosynthesis protein C